MRFCDQRIETNVRQVKINKYIWIMLELIWTEKWINFETAIRTLILRQPQNSLNNILFQFSFQIFSVQNWIAVNGKLYGLIWMKALFQSKRSQRRLYNMLRLDMPLSYVFANVCSSSREFENAILRLLTIQLRNSMKIAVIKSSLASPIKFSYFAVNNLKNVHVTVGDSQV